MSPEPFAAIKNAIEHYRIDDILISTLAGEQSKWLEEGLIEKVKEITDKPVEHYRGAGGGEPSSRRNERRLDGGAGLMEMRFDSGSGSPPAPTSTSTTVRPRPTRARGSTARRSGSCSSSSPRSCCSGRSSPRTSSSASSPTTGPWPPDRFELPVAVAGVNTAILVSSSFTVHWALESIRRGNRRGMQMGLATTWLLGATFLFIQINEYVHIGFSARDGAFGSIFYGLTGLHGAHVFVGLMLLAFANIRAWRGHFGPEAKDHLGVEVPGIYWHFVDVMWIIVFTTVYIL